MPVNCISFDRNHLPILHGRQTNLGAGLYKVQYNLIVYPPPNCFLKILIFFPKTYLPFPSSPLDILPRSLNIIGKMILLPLSISFTVYSSPQPGHSLPGPSSKTWYSSSTDLINSPKGGRNFIHPNLCVGGSRGGQDLTQLVLVGRWRGRDLHIRGVY